MKVAKLFSEADQRKIEAAVKEAETGTSGEIVPAVVDASSRYIWLAHRSALFGLVAASLVAAYFHFYQPFFLELWTTFLFQAVGWLLGWGIGRSSWGIRLWLDQRSMAEEVHEAAQSAFLQHGLANTRDRTGVLVFLSLLEHRVEILADQGIHEKVGSAFWEKEVQAIVSAMRAGQPVEGLVNCLRHLGETLRLHFPAQADDKNELGDHLR